MSTKKRFKDIRNREIMQMAMDSYKDHQAEVEAMMEAKRKKEQDQSKKDYIRALNILENGHDGGRS